MRILAIESSCDETAAAVVEDGIRVHSNVIASSRAAFERTGGVIPEDAARRQVECILPVVHEAMNGVAASWDEIDAIAVTRGPGLLGSLLVGTVAARGLAQIHKKPLIGVHHTLGHLSSSWLDTDPADIPRFPVLTLSASGGHTDLWLRTSHVKGRLLGRTRDDAAGEAFDKGASLLGLPYPGGPAIGRSAEQGDAARFDFPRPLSKEQTFDYSFSGLKTALRYTIRDLEEDAEKKIQDEGTGSGSWILDPELIADLAASFQHAICRHLCDRIMAAVGKHPEIEEIHVVGGVSANTYLRSMLTQMAGGRTVRFPKTLSYCTDNAAMIGAAAEFMTREMKEDAFIPFAASATLPLETAIVTI